MHNAVREASTQYLNKVPLENKKNIVENHKVGIMLCVKEESRTGLYSSISFNKHCVFWVIDLYLTV